LGRLVEIYYIGIRMTAAMMDGRQEDELFQVLDEFPLLFVVD
jgi:hypothetical protein